MVLATITAIARHVHLIAGIIRDDIDNAGDRVATIQSGSGPVQDLYPFYVRHIDTGIGIIAGQTLTVFQDNHVFLCQSVHIHRSPLSVFHKYDTRIQLGHRILEIGYARLFQVFSRKHFHGNRGITHAAMRTGTGYHHLIDIHILFFQLNNDIFFRVIRLIHALLIAKVSHTNTMSTIRKVQLKFSAGIRGCTIQGFRHADIRARNWFITFIHDLTL